MDNTTVQIAVAAIVIAVVAAATAFAWRGYRARASLRRMQRMLEATGLDPEIASSGDLELIMGEARQRCSRCNSGGQCQRWLDGDRSESNEFCPNSLVFDILSKYSSGASR